MHKTIALSIAMSAVVLAVLAFVFHNFFSYQRIPSGVTVDKILVLKSKHELHAYSGGREIVVYKIAIGQNPVGDKECEGDKKTPEGLYTINAKNPNSAYHKNLGISYPNEQDIEQARRLGKPPGGDVKIHGFRNGSTNIGKFHCLKDWTYGCIALTNEEVDELYNHTPVGTPIEIRK